MQVEFAIKVYLEYGVQPVVINEPKKKHPRKDYTLSQWPWHSYNSPLKYHWQGHAGDRFPTMVTSTKLMR